MPLSALGRRQHTSHLTCLRHSCDRGSFFLAPPHAYKIVAQKTFCSSSVRLNPLKRQRKRQRLTHLYGVITFWLRERGILRDAHDREQHCMRSSFCVRVRFCVDLDCGGCTLSGVCIVIFLYLPYPVLFGGYATMWH